MGVRWMRGVLRSSVFVLQKAIGMYVSKAMGVFFFVALVAQVVL